MLIIIERHSCLIHPYQIFFFNDPAPTDIYTLSLHDALPISGFSDTEIRKLLKLLEPLHRDTSPFPVEPKMRSEEHTSELQSRFDLVCRLLLEKKNTNRTRLMLVLSYMSIVISS